jgi:hypothetical protein
VLQFKASPSRNVVCLSKGEKAKVECPRHSVPAGFKAIYLALAIFDLDPLNLQIATSLKLL